MTVVIKFGGNAMVDSAALKSFISSTLDMHARGLKPVVVHGGGPQISAALEKAGIVSEFLGGYRVTTPEAVQVVRDVLVNEVNREIVDLLNADGNNAKGLAGDTQDLLIAEHRTVLVAGVPTDIGLVGEVVEVDTAAINAVLADQLIPVISTAARDRDGKLYNVNADTATAAVAVALEADQMVMLTDVPGVYANWPDRDSLIESMTASELTAMLPTLQSGMVPKMEACLRAVEGGVPSVQVTGDLSTLGTKVTQG